ncbi:MAG: ABC transporter ATP-binding protein [Thermoanaerobaculia bacterium]|nr:ABC transporter ATP-binding protein [Thermoanaerobaculia bacterium]
MESPESASEVVAAKALGKRFGRRWALAHVDLVVRPGEAVLLAGANGSGKTTLLRLIAGLGQPTTGSLRIFGRDPGEERLGCRRRLSLVSHENYLYPPLTALETLRLWARLAGLALGDEELVRLLAEVELADRRDHRVGGFSAGMRKRLTLLRTRLEEPGLILLDEPLSALDAAGRTLVERWIGGFVAAGRTVIMASHAVERMSRVAHRGVLLDRGQVAWSGPAGEIPGRLEGHR